MLLRQVPVLSLEGSELLLFLGSLKLGAEVFLTEIDVEGALIKVGQDVAPYLRMELDVLGKVNEYLVQGGLGDGKGVAERSVGALVQLAMLCNLLVGEVKWVNLNLLHIDYFKM